MADLRYRNHLFSFFMLRIVIRYADAMAPASDSSLEAFSQDSLKVSFFSGRGYQCIRSYMHAARFYHLAVL